MVKQLLLVSLHAVMKPSDSHPDLNASLKLWIETNPLTGSAFYVKLTDTFTETLFG